MKAPTTKKLALLHSPKRHRPVEFHPKRSAINLSLIRNEISQRLTCTNWLRRMRTERLLTKDSPILESAHGKRPDSFEFRYSGEDHTFKHALVGTMHIRQVGARTLGDLIRKNALHANAELEAAKSAISLHSPTSPPLLQSPSGHERPWRAFSAIKHLIQLRIPLYLIPKLGELVPRQPYQHPKAFMFLKACRMGNAKAVRALLRENRWLSLCFDHIKQTGLHWLAKRGYCELMKDLVDAGTYVDSRDSAGRTALFIATYKGNLNEVRVLLSLKANPFIKTNGGKTPQQVCKSGLVQKIIEKSMLLHILLKFVPSQERASIWEKEGLDYFQASVDIIREQF